MNDSGQPGWFWMYNAVIDEYGPQIGANALAVYTVLCRFANSDRQCFPSVTTIGGRIGLSANTVRAALQSLIEVGLVSVKQRARHDGGQQSNLYTLQNLKGAPHHLSGGTSKTEEAPLHHLSTKDDSLEQDSMNKTQVVAVSRTGESDSSRQPENVLPPASAVPRKGQPHIAILDAWTAALPGGSPIVTSVYERYARPASALAKAGITPAQVQEFTRFLSTQSFWQGKLIGLDYIAENIRAYLAQKGQVNADSNAHSAGDGEPHAVKQRVARPIHYIPDD